MTAMFDATLHPSRLSSFQWTDDLKLTHRDDSVVGVPCYLQQAVVRDSPVLGAGVLVWGAGAVDAWGSSAAADGAHGAQEVWHHTYVDHGPEVSVGAALQRSLPVGEVGVLCPQEERAAEEEVDWYPDSEHSFHQPLGC